MSDISNFTGKFRASRDGLQDGASARVIKRPRESLVCNQCRRSKLRCDRGHPCSSCVRRDEASICSYNRLSGPRVDNTRSSAAEERLAHLEFMVKELMQNQASVQSRTDEAPAKPVTPPALPHDVTRSEDQLRGENHDGIPYVGSTHWSAILDDIQELKVVLGKESDIQEVDDPIASKTPGPGGELIFGLSNNYSLQGIIAQFLPPKSEVDRLLSIYFQGKTFIAPFIHTYQFQRQYRDFWADPAGVNPLWLSVLFSICYTASIIKERIRSFHASQNELAAGDPNLHIAAAQCLVLGEYHRPTQLALEALGLYANSKNLRSLDPCREAGAILGMVVRMAYELGLHRDPDSCGSFTVFEGEVRRRIWASLKQMDLMLSFMLGLPSNICLENCDTKSPRNLLDSDFDVDTQELPEPRSEQEATRILWFIVKDRQMVNFGKACKDALSFTENSAAEILALDQQIREMYTTIPDILRTRPLSESLADAPFLIMTRLYVEFIYLKSLCVLHRRYMVRGDLFSTQCCVEAGKRIVSKFIEMYKEFSPGGQLCTERWMLSNFTVNDFLLGIMVLCLVLHTRHSRTVPTPTSAHESDRVATSETTINAATESEVLLLLQQSHAILIEKSKASRDVRRVSHAVRLTLNGAKARSRSPISSMHGQEATFHQLSQPSVSAPHDATFSDPQLQAAVDSLNRVDLASMSLSLQQHSLPQPQLQPVTHLQPTFQHSGTSYDAPPFGVLDPFNFNADIDNIDWNVFDPGVGFLGQDHDLNDMEAFMPPRR